MNLVIAVIDDLWGFATSSLVRLLGIQVVRPHVSRPHHDDSIVYVAPRPEPLLIPASAGTGSQESGTHAHLETVFEPVISKPQRNTVVYVSAQGAPLRSTPARGTDNVILRMPYGSMLVAMETTDEWVRVFYRGTEGYVELHDLADRAAYVYPKFVIGEANHAYDPNTERVRAVIADEFSYGEGALPLQSEEYVLYKLRRNGIDVAWGSERPRTPGSWATATKSIPGVTRTIEPTPRSVMEWSFEHGGGHLAFVEAVLPDGTVTISEAGWPSDGVYNERMLVREEWLRLAPTFLSFT